MSKRIEENIDEGLWVTYEFTSLIASKKTQFQQADIIDSVPFGKVLILDGLMQSSELDEYLYHECLVHVPLLCHPCPKTVFIGGGGEGSTAREVLKHKSVEKCVMVDIDGDVVEFCKQAWEKNRDAFSSPRLELIIDDAKARLENSPIKFDVIIMDLDDPLEGGPCYQLYTKTFYEMAKTKLNPGGIFITQSAAVGPRAYQRVFSPVHNTLKHVFPKVFPYARAIYSFADEWGYNMAFTDEKMALPSPAEIDERIASRIDGELRYLDGCSFSGIFCLSKEVRKFLAEEKRILSVDQPAFFYGKIN